MSLVVREVSKDMKCKIKQADRDIHMAIERKTNYPSLSRMYYDFSVNNINDMLKLHSGVEELIEEYRDKHGEPPSTMLDFWKWEHDILLEEVEEIKILQEFYKNL